MTQLTFNLALAWAERGARAAAELAQAAAAPTLFKPERIAELERDDAKAKAEYLRWEFSA